MSDTRQPKNYLHEPILYFKVPFMSLSARIIKSSAFLFLTKFITKGIGLISTLILARLLTPEDYGIVAIATVIIHLFDAISNTGTREYVIHKEYIDKDIINTAWTLNLITKIIFWLCFLLLIPVITNFYAKPELNEVLFIISLILPLGAFKNVGIILYEKEFNYKPLFYLGLCQKLIAFAFTISIALWIESYWALIIGTVISFIALVAGSYIIHDFRPRLSLANFKDQWDFSKWMLPRGLLGFSKAEFDVFLVSKIFDISSLGGFNLMKSLVSMVGRDVVMPATEPLLASFSKAKHDDNKLSFQFSICLFLILLFSLPVTAFIWMFDKEIVLILLGDKWVKYSSVLGLLSILIVAASLSSVIQHLLTSLGKTKVQFYYELFGLFFTVIILLTISFDDLAEFSFARSLVALALSLFLLLYIKSVVNTSLINLLTLLLPVFISLACASFVVYNLHFAESLPLLLYVFICGVFFSLSYIIILVAILFFYRNKKEILYLKWLVGEAFQVVRNKHASKQSSDIENPPPNQ